MVKHQNSGWPGERQRHVMSSRGVKTKPPELRPLGSTIKRSDMVFPKNIKSILKKEGLFPVTHLNMKPSLVLIKFDNKETLMGVNDWVDLVIKMNKNTKIQNQDGSTSPVTMDEIVKAQFVDPKLHWELNKRTFPKFEGFEIKRVEVHTISFYPSLKGKEAKDLGIGLYKGDRGIIKDEKITENEFGLQTEYTFEDGTTVNIRAINKIDGKPLKSFMLFESDNVELILEQIVMDDKNVMARGLRYV